MFRVRRSARLDERIHQAGSTGARRAPKNSSGAWQLAYSKQALKDAKKVKASGLKPKVEALLAILQADPFQNPPGFEKLVGDLSGACSRRIDIHDRLVYEVMLEERIVRVLRMWTHDE